MNRIITGIFFVGALTMSSCSKQSGSGTNQAPDKSTGQQVVEGMTGKTAVDAGERAKQQIRAISEKEKAERDAVLSGQ